MPFAGGREFRERGGVPEHAVDRLGEHDGVRLAARGQCGLDRIDVVVTGDRHAGTGEAAGVHQGCVDVRIRDDQVATARQRTHRAEVRQVTGGEDQCGGLCAEPGQSLLQFLVHTQGAGDQARGPGSGAPGPRRGRGSLDDAWIPGQPEVIVAGQVQQRPRPTAGRKTAADAVPLPLLGGRPQPGEKRLTHPCSAAAPRRRPWRS